MRALLVVPRLPGTGHTGDRVRAEVQLAALREAGFEVVLVGGAPVGASLPALDGLAGIHAVPRTRGALASALVRAAVRGEPLQSALVAGPWRTALEAAARRGRYDLVVVSLARGWPHVAGRLPAAPLVVDYVDALGEAARQATRQDPAWWRRLYWTIEIPRLSRVESAAASGAAALVATTPFDAAHLSAGTIALPHGVTIGPPPLEPRGLVVAFSGRLGYRPNLLAARRLVHDIWPAVHRRVPAARLVLGGADAPREVRRWHGVDGVRVESPVREMPAFLRRALVAAAPVDLGTGTPNKIYEAFEAGAAVVACEAVAARAELDGVRPPVTVAEDDSAFTAALVRYLENPDEAVDDGQEGRRFVEDHADRAVAVSRFAEIFRRAAGRGAPGPSLNG